MTDRFPDAVPAMTLDALREQVERDRDKATIRLFREAKTLGLLGDPFVDALADALGEVSLDEALAALHVKAKEQP